jgi:hypothetical protein
MFGWELWLLLMQSVSCPAFSFVYIHEHINFLSEYKPVSEPIKVKVKLSP